MDPDRRSPASAAPEQRVARAFDCSAILPTLSTGTHTLELASFVVDGSARRSRARVPARCASSPADVGVDLLRIVQARRHGRAGAIEPGSRCRRPASSIGSRIRRRWFDLRRRAWWRRAADSRRCARRDSGARSFSGDHAAGRRASRDRPRSELRRERARRMRFTPLTRRATGSSSRSRDSAIWTACSRERAVLLDRTEASVTGASGALRVGPDGKLYVALDSASDGRIAGKLCHV